MDYDVISATVQISKLWVSENLRNMGVTRTWIWNDMEKKWTINHQKIAYGLHHRCYHTYTYIYIYIIAVILDDFCDIDQIRQHRISKISCRGEPGYECCARLASPDGGTFFIIFRRRMDDF